MPRKRFNESLSKFIEMIHWDEFRDYFHPPPHRSCSAHFLTNKIQFYWASLKLNAWCGSSSKGTAGGITTGGLILGHSAASWEFTSTSSTQRVPRVILVAVHQSSGADAHQLSGSKQTPHLMGRLVGGFHQRMKMMQRVKPCTHCDRLRKLFMFRRPSR